MRTAEGLSLPLHSPSLKPAVACAAVVIRTRLLAFHFPATHRHLCYTCKKKKGKGSRSTHPPDKNHRITRPPPPLSSSFQSGSRQRDDIAPRFSTPCPAPPIPNKKRFFFPFVCCDRGVSCQPVALPVSFLIPLLFIPTARRKEGAAHFTQVGSVSSPGPQG